MVEIPVQVSDPRLVQARRRQIVEAARGVFRQKGFHNTTVRDIGRAAGLTQGTLYNYIGCKEDILFLVLEQVVTDHRHKIEAASRAETDPARRLRAVVRASVETSIEHEDDLLFLYQESHSLPPPALRKLLADVRGGVELIMGVLRETLPPAELARINLDLVANVVNFLPAIAPLRRWDLRRRCTLEETVDGLTDFILRGLGLSAEP